MKRWVKRSLKIFFISLGSLLLLTLGIVGYVLYVLLTPSKLTPILEDVANHYIDGRLDFESVELTAVASYPNVSLSLRDGVLLRDSLLSGSRTDTIVDFKALNITVNPYELIFSNRLTVSRIELQEPQIYAFVDSTGRANWDVFKFPTDTTTVTDTTSMEFNTHIALEEFTISEGRLTLDDRSTRIYGRVDSLNSYISGNFSGDTQVDFRLGFGGGLFWYDGKLVTNKTRVELALQGDYLHEPKIINIAKSEVKLNDLNLQVTGSLAPDDFDLKADFVSPSLENVVKLIPTDYLPEANNMRADGSVSISSTLKGGFKDGKTPEVKVFVRVIDAAFHYVGFQYGIDHFDMSAVAYIDLKIRSNSWLDLTHFYVNGDAVTLDLKGRVSDLFGNARFAAQTTLNLDFQKLYKTLPIAPHGTRLEGGAKFTGDIESSKGQFDKGQWGRVKANGLLDINDITFSDSTSNLLFKTNKASLQLSQKDDKLLQINGRLSDIYTNFNQQYQGDLSNVRVALSAYNLFDSLNRRLVGDVDYKDLDVTVLGKDVALHSSASRMKLALRHGNSALEFSTDTLRINTPKSVVELSRADVDVDLVNREVVGNVGFNRLDINTPFFPLPISIDSTNLRVNRNIIELNDAKIKVGRSDIRMNGSVANLLAPPTSGEKIIIRGAITSNFLNLNQIILATSKGAIFAEETLKGLFPTPDTVEMQVADTSVFLPVIPIPSNVDAQLSAKVNRLRYSTILARNVQGGFIVKDGTTLFKNLGLQWEGAKLNTTILYAPTSAQRAVTTLELFTDSLNLSSLKKIADIDTLSPMVKSLEGFVSLSLAAKAPMNITMTPDLDSVRLAVQITGDSVGIIDNPTFREVAKMLMFKQKETIIIDSLFIQATAKKGKITLYPFPLQIDRYRFALGGEQYLSGDMMYHVSVLKSPIPFKFGVNVFGNFDDIKFRIVKTQYKALFPPDSPIRKDNESYEQMLDEILSPLK